MVGKLFKVVITRKALKRLVGIDDYYKKNASPAAARKVREGLAKEVRSLEKLPESKPLLPTKKKANPPYRYSKKWSFRIVFQFFKKEDTVSVVDFLHDKEKQ
ncbi:MAG: type II toxin-antitoxin system RelE/ParE family toxin [Saprospirales bacterium]|nr:type II toxin-antitoxin system RelE/ParE family toxin [Saprospirales bacterium]